MKLVRLSASFLINATRIGLCLWSEILGSIDVITLITEMWLTPCFGPWRHRGGTTASISLYMIDNAFESSRVDEDDEEDEEEEEAAEEEEEEEEKE